MCAIGGNADLPALRSDEFKRISGLAYEHFGLCLAESKRALVAARLGKRIRELGLTSFQQYYEYVKGDASGDAMTAMVDLLTTNHTSFFREPRHFELLRKTIYPMLRGRQEIHVWSAACSSGEEPYSIAMSLLEESSDAGMRVRIKATDISTRVLKKGRRGVYAAERFEGIDLAVMKRYLLKGTKAAHPCYRFKKEVRQMIDFEYLNLMERLPERYVCSVIFCRNLMIYLDRPTQRDLVQRLAEQLEDGGYLLIGHSESLNNIPHSFEYVGPATYRKPGVLYGSRARA